MAVAAGAAAFCVAADARACGWEEEAEFGDDAEEGSILAGGATEAAAARGWGAVLTGLGCVLPPALGVRKMSALALHVVRMTSVKMRSFFLSVARLNPSGSSEIPCLL